MSGSGGGGWWLQTADRSGAIFTDSSPGDAVIRTDGGGYRLLLGAGSNVASALSVGSTGVVSPLVSSARFEDTSRGYSDLAGEVASLHSKSAGLASGSLILPGAVDLTSKVSGALPVKSGGTGASTWPAGCVPFADAVGGSNPLASDPELRFSGSELTAPAVRCTGSVSAGSAVLVGAPGAANRYQLRVATGGDLVIDHIDAAGASNTYLDFGELRALLSGLRVSAA